MQNNGKTFSLYIINKTVAIKDLHKKFKEGSIALIEEKKENYETKIISKTEIKSCFFGENEHKYFSLKAEIERPKIGGGKSKKEVEILISFDMKQDKLLIIPIVTDLQAHIIMRNVFSNFEYKFYHIIPENKKELFVSWLYEKEDSSLRENIMFLKKIKAYKCTTDDNIGHFRGKSESTIAEYLETMQIIVLGYDMGYLKLSLAYNEGLIYDFVLGFYENHNFKVYYNDKILESNLFKSKKNCLELIIYIVNILIPEMYLVFIEENWTKEHMLKLRLKLADTIIQNMNGKKEEIIEELELIENKKAAI